MKNKTYIDYAQTNGLMVMAAFHSERVDDAWNFKIDPTDYKLRKITMLEKAKNATIIKLGGKLDNKYIRPFIYNIPEARAKEVL